MNLQKPYGIVFTGGECPPPERILPLARSSDLLVAADSGYDSCLGLGLIPQVVLGDFDSIQDRNILDKDSGLEVVRYSTEKDYSDTFLALEFAKKRILNQILAGGGGGLLDHLLGNLSLFHGDHNLAPKLWITAKEYVFLVKSSMKISGESGHRISIVPLEKSTFESEGLEWELTNLDLSPATISLSNRFRNSEVSIRILSGRALVVLPFTGTFVPSVNL